jgi:transmembrane sensor
MAKCETAAEIDAVAAGWTARMDRGPLQPDEERDLQAWLAGDQRRLGALARAQAVLVRAGQMPLREVSLPMESAPAPSGTRSRVQRWSAMAAMFVAVVIGTMLVWQADQTSTSRGEVRLVPMPDGSAVVLNTATRISTSFTDAHRRIELLEGEALFNVAKDATRPFIVTAADTQVRALGTSFSVRRMPGGTVKVLVREGVVEITRDQASSSQAPVRAVANVKVIVPPQAPQQVTELPSAEVARDLVWREGVISLDGVSLQQAADEFARYSDLHITFASPAIANRKVTGLFAANDPAGFARAVALSMNLSADVQADRVVLRD